MQNTFKNYEPAGPLGYLLMDNNGEMQLGLYKKIGFNSLVLILKFKTDYFILHPSREFLDAFFRNERSVIDMAYHPGNTFISDLDDKPLTKEEAWPVFNYIISQLAGTVGQQLFYTVYPNYYYLYREWVEIFNN